MASSDDGNSSSNWLEKGCYREKPENLNQTKWEKLDEKALSAIQLCLTNRVAGGIDGENFIRIVEKVLII